MKYYLIAGEASGDLHGSNLVRALKEEDTDSDFRAWGGDLMETAGATIIKHYQDLAFMGLIEVVKNIRTILKNIRFCKEDILNYQPDVLILIDYPGFNLRIAKWAKKQGIKVFYYISPQLWAWHTSRVHGIKKTVDRMFVILPFEKKFYQKYDYEVDFVGHPLLDVIKCQAKKVGFRTQNRLNDDPIIALLPGSRKQEINQMLDIMLQVVSAFPAFQFVIGGAPSIPDSFYKSIMDKHNTSGQVRLLQNQTYPLLQNAHAALVTSGTATLETGLFQVPQVVCYKGNPFSYLLAKRLIDVKYIALVNLILDQPLVKELIQSEMNPKNLTLELHRLMDPEHRAHLATGYQELQEKLGRSGASKRAAKLMVKYLKKRNR